MRIDGLAALVTGGGSGLGEATAEMLARRGTKVAVLDRSGEAARAVASRIGGLGLAADVTAPEQIAAAVAAAEVHHGVARILVNCAGAAMMAKMIDEERRPAPLAPFLDLFAINVGGTFAMAAEFASRLVAAGRIDGEEQGVIVNTASVAAYDGQIGLCAYASSKAGVIGLTLPMMRELAPHGIRVMTIAPGIFGTPMTMGHLAPEEQARQAALIPFPSRFGQAPEFAHMVEAIVDNPMLNGETIRLDAGLSLSAMRMGDALVGGRPAH